MKNTLQRFLLLFVFALATFGLSAQPTTLVSYDFDASNQGWATGGTNATFAWGIPQNYQPYFNSASDAFFFTGLDAFYNDQEYSWVQSPAIDLSSAVLPELHFSYYADCQTAASIGGDGAYLQYSTDGSTWTTMNMASYDAQLSVLFGYSPAVDCWAQALAWTPSVSDISMLAGESTVYFRFVFESDANQGTTGPGFGFNNFEIVETALTTSASLSIDAPVSQNCALSNAENVIVTVTNDGQTTYSSFDLTFTVGGGTPVTETVTQTLAPTQSYTYTSIATFDFSTSPVDVTVDFLEGVSSFTTSANATVTHNGLSPIVTFPYLTSNPQSGNHWATTAGIDMYSYPTSFRVHGGSGLTWQGGSDNTTADQAWNQNTDNQVTFTTCMVDATSLPTLELYIPYFQIYSTYGTKYAWFRVLVNGVAVADIDGIMNQNPSGPDNSDWKALRYNLDAYAGTSFELELQAACKFSSDYVDLNTFYLRQRLANDLSVVEIVNPETGCALGSQSVTISIKNYGTMPQSNFDVAYWELSPSTSVVTETYTGTIPSGFTANYTFTTPVLFNSGDVKHLVAATQLVGDEDTYNNEFWKPFITDISNDLSSVYVQDFDLEDPVVTSAGWAIEDANVDGSSWEWFPGSPDGYYGFDFEGAAGNDWLFSNCFNLSASMDYQICFNYATYLSGSTKNLDVYLVDAQSSGATMVSLASYAGFDTNDDFVFDSKTFTPASDGVYYIAFKASGSSTFEAEYIFLNDIAIKQYVSPDFEITDILLQNGAVDACMLPDPIIVDLDISHNGGSTLCAGTEVEVQLYVNGVLFSTESLLLNSDFAQGDVIDYVFTGFDASAPGEYNFQAFVNFGDDPNTSNDDATISITNYGYPQDLAFTGLDAGYCLNASAASLTGTFTSESYAGPYIQSFSATAGTIVDNADGTGTYTPDALGNQTITYTVENGLGCQSTTDLTTYVTDPTIDLGVDVYTTYPVGITLDPNAGGVYTYMWSDGATTGTLNPDYFGVYGVTATEGSCSVSDEIEVFQDQNIDLRAGWGMFSTLIDVSQLADASVVGIFAPHVADLVIVKDGSGNVYWPNPPAPLTPIDNIGNLVNGQGYQYKMTSPATLTISGRPLVPENVTLSLPMNYSMIGFLRQTASSISSELSSILANVVIVKNQDGQVFWPFFNIDMIGNFNPGQGYKIKMAAADDLIYSANSGGAKSAVVFNNQTQHFAQVRASGNNMTIGIDANSLNLNLWDEVAITNAEGTVVGSSVYDGNNMAIVVAGDDNLTSEIEGLVAGEEFGLIVWNQMTNTEYTCTFDVESGNVSYAKDAITVLKNIVFGSENESDAAELYQNTPNPASNSTMIRFFVPADGFVRLAVYNVVGELVEEVMAADVQAGYHDVNLDLNNYAQGTYFYKLISSDFVQTKTMSVEK